MIAKNAALVFTHVFLVTSIRLKNNFIPSFASSLAQLCKSKRQTTAIYRLGDADGEKKLGEEEKNENVD